MKRRFFILAMIVCGLVAIGATWPTDSVRTKDWGSEVLTDADLEAQYDLLHDWVNDFADETSGHKHDATTNEGPLIDLNGSTIGVTGTLAVENGGTETTSLTDGGVLLGSGTDAITAMSALGDGAIVVGDGTTDPVSLSAFTSSTGTLKHESGGIELDISSIGTGDLLGGASAGTMEIIDGGASSDGDVLAIQSDGTANFQSLPIPDSTAFTCENSASAGAGTNDLVSVSKTITSGSSYLVLAYMRTVSTSFSGSDDFTFSLSGGTGISASDSIAESDTEFNQILFDIGTGSTGSTTFKMQSTRNSGTGSVTVDACILVVEFYGT